MLQRWRQWMLVCFGCFTSKCAGTLHKDMCHIRALCVYKKQQMQRWMLVSAASQANVPHSCSSPTVLKCHMPSFGPTVHKTACKAITTFLKCRVQSPDTHEPCHITTTCPRMLAFACSSRTSQIALNNRRIVPTAQSLSRLVLVES